MLRVSVLLLCFLLLAACDSSDTDVPADSSLFSVSVETPSGEPVSGLSVAMEYALGGSNGGERIASSVVLRYLVVNVVGFELYFVEWEAEAEDGLTRYVLEGEPTNEAFEDVASVTPEGPGVAYSVEVEGQRYSAFRLRFENADGSTDYSEVVEVVAEAEPEYSVSLNTNYPNPFSSRGTTFAFEFDQATAARLELNDLEGREVAVIPDSTYSVGQHRVFWEPGEGLTGGIYRARLATADTSISVLSVYAGPNWRPDEEEIRVRTALGTTGDDGRLATDDRALFPQRYTDIEAKFRDENNVDLGTIGPADAITIILRDGAGGERRYERNLDGEANGFELTWDPE